MKTQWYVSPNGVACASRYRCFTFWLDEGYPYDRRALEQDGYELVNTHTLLADPERGLLVSHDFEFVQGKEDGWMLVEADTHAEAWLVFDERSAA